MGFGKVVTYQGNTFGEVVIMLAFQASGSGSIPERHGVWNKPPVFSRRSRIKEETARRRQTKMDSPRLPIELVEEIVGLFWSDDSLQVSPQDRVTFIVSSLFVNRCWSSLFLAIASRDVYIPTPAFAFHLCDALQFHRDSSQSKSKSKPLQFRTSASCSFSSSTFSLCSSLASLMPQRCRSLTFQYVGTKHPSQLFVQKQDYEHSLIGSSIFSLLRCLTPPPPSKSIHVSPLSPLTPHLHSISLDLHSCTTPSLFTYYKFHSSCFPPQVSSLSIHFHYPSSISPSTIEQEFLLDLSSTGVRKGCLEGVNELRLFGCSVGVVRDMVDACPAISRLETGSIVEYAVQKWTKINFDTPALFCHFPTFQPVPPIL
ncbi:hypothetical protein K435DRAFT_974745 [Dendrothele bispora CBS 962.96]|uniref:Uncharacterized protein n=1 Tax=Dendrothele bispora (strain CBS 962.96) TaxID=1314807 RepID=A0A4S8KJJ6_DENBC|nr:hypothetical protein K435DRAFT_974745 [Dendrothele bispora CBS 962.96]